MAGNPADKRFRGLDFAHSPEMLRTFNNTFGLHEFRGSQLEAINATILGQNVFVVGGNGAGKSLCYQLPACLSAGVTVVISPIKALIQDQIQILTELGIVARTVSGDQDNINEGRICNELLENEQIIKLLYVTPKKMRMSRQLVDALKSLFNRGLLARFVIDEAHCISQWGSDFRTDYRPWNEHHRLFPGVPIIALSGPIAPLIQEDILNQLQMTNPQVFTIPFYRFNLKYAVEKRTTKLGDRDCITWINEHCPGDSGIVYCWRKDDCDDMAASLNNAGLLACSYHARMTDEVRERVQNEWKENKCLVICTTAEAFGMGIHKPDVRYVIHTFLPKSMESYNRATGRAGRDGNISRCILFYTDNDVQVFEWVLNKDKTMDESIKERKLEDQRTMHDYCENTEDCRIIQLLTYFGDNTEAICDNCQNAQTFTAVIPQHCLASRKYSL